MTEPYFWKGAFDNEPDDSPENTDDWSTMNDTWQTLKSGVQTGVARPVLSAVRAGAEKAGYGNVATITRNLSQDIDENVEDNTKAMSPGGRKSLQADITSTDFWERPGRAIFLKSINMTPTIAAAVAPALLMPGPGTALAAATLAGGGLGASEYIDNVYKLTDATPDEELQKKNPYYAGLRSMGMDEEAARADLSSTLRSGGAEIVNFLIGAGNTLVGPAGNIVRRGVVGAAGKSLPKRVAMGAGEGAAGEALQEGALDVTTQQAGQQLDATKEFDGDQLVKAVLEGGFFGGLFGGATGVMNGRGKKPAKKPVEAPEVDPVDTDVGKVLQDQLAEGKAIPESNKTVVDAITQQVVQDTQNAPVQPTPEPAPPSGPSTFTTTVNINGDERSLSGSYDPAEIARAAEAPQPEAIPVAEAAPVEAPPVQVEPAAEAQPRGVETAPELIEPAPALAPEPVAPVVAEAAPAAAEPPPPVVEPARDSAPVRSEPPRVLPDLDAEARLQKTLEEYRAATEEELKAKEVGLARNKRGDFETYQDMSDSRPRQKFLRDALIASKKSNPPQWALDAVALPKLPRGNKATPAEKGAYIDRLQELHGQQMEWLEQNRPAPKGPTKAEQLKAQNAEKRAAEAKAVAERTREEEIAALVKEQKADKASDVTGMGMHGGKGLEFNEARVNRDLDEGADLIEALDTAHVTKDEVLEVGEQVAADEDTSLPTQLPPARERPKLELKEGEGYSIGKAKTPPKVEVIKRRVAAKKTEKQFALQAAPAQPRDALVNPITRARVLPRDVRSLGDHLRALNLKDATHLTGAARPMATYFKNLVMKHAGEVPVKVVSPEQMAELAKLNPAFAHLPDGPGGYYDPNNHEIVVRSDNIASTETASHLMLHEGLHAAFFHAIQTSKPTKSAIRSIMDTAGQEWNAKYRFDEQGAGTTPDGVAYGFTNEHEFISEAFSNPAFQDFLARIDAPKHIVDALGLDAPRKPSLWALFVATVRRALGMSRGMHSMLEATIKIGELLDEAAPAIRDRYLGKKIAARAAGQRQGLQAGPNLMAEARDRADVVNTYTGARVTPNDVRSLGEHLQALNVRGLSRDFSTLNKLLITAFKNVLLRHVADVPVKVVSPEQMGELVRGDWRFGVPSGPAGYYHPQNHEIVIRSDSMRNPDTTAIMLLHEGAHAAFLHAIELEPLYKAGIRAIMEEAYKQGEARPEILEHYGFSNEHEFISEAFSDPAFQEFLSRTVAPDVLVESLGLNTPRKSTLWQLFVDSVRRVLGMPKNAHSLLDAVLWIGEALDDGARPIREAAYAPGGRLANVALRPILKPSTMMAEARDRVNRMSVGAKLRQMGDKASTMTMLAQRAHDLFGADRPAVELAKLNERMRVERDTILREEGGEEIVRRGADLQRKHGETFNTAAKLVHEATDLDISLDGPNTHLGKDATSGWQAKARLPDVLARFQALPKDIQKWVLDGDKFFRSQRNKMSLEQLRSILHNAGIDEPGLAEDIHNGTLTEDDLKKRFADDPFVRKLNDVLDFKKIDGTYFPLMRHGDYVVNARKEFDTPNGALRVDRDTVQFSNASDTAARKQARAFVEGAPLKVLKVRHTWVDKNDPRVELPGDHVDAVHAYQVRLQTQHTQFAESEYEANKIVQDLRAAGLKTTEPQLKNLNPNDEKSALYSSDMQYIINSLRQRGRFQSLSPTAKSEIEQALIMATAGARANGRIQSTLLARRGVSGYSEDILRNTAQYAQMAARFLARLRYFGKIEDQLKVMKDFADARTHAKGALRRSELYREIQQRVYANDDTDYESGFATFTRRALQLSMLDKLAGVSYHVINSMEPWTTALPVIGGRHGAVKATRSLKDAYNVIGARGAVMAGVRDTAGAYRRDGGFTNYVDKLKAEIHANTKGAESLRLAELVDYLHEHGLLDRESGQEVRLQAQPQSNLLGRGLDRAELMARQVGAAMEAINRGVTGLAAYRLEYARHGDHQKAMSYAYDVVHDTMGNYSSSNQAPIFNHPLGRLALQFKKFAQKTYYLLGKTARGALEGDPEKAKQFAGLMFTHAVVAGALGLPWEPIKLALLASNALGVTGASYDDFENLVRETMAGAFGKKGGEIASRGVFRAAGIDVASRLEMSSLLTFSSPKSEKQQDLKAWFFDTAAGAPIGTILQQVEGVKSALGGEFVDAAKKSIPLKAVKDVVRAGEGYFAGKQNRAGRELMAPYSGYEAAIRAVGFAPSREVEGFSQSRAYQGAVRAQSTEKTEFTNQWVKASPAERARLWGKIEKWNRARPKDAQLTRAQLDAAVKRRDKEKTSGSYVNGMRITKPTEHLFKQHDIYGAR